MNNNAIYRYRAEIMKAFAHPIRLKIIDFLADGEKCVCQIFPIVGGERSNTSRHLAILSKANIVESKRHGANVFYKLKMKCAADFFSCCNRMIKENAKEQSRIAKNLGKCK